MSGYRHCSCRDCDEIICGGDEPLEFCDGCIEAGCPDKPGAPDVECDAPHTYCEGDSECGEEIIDGKAYCTVCGKEF